MQIILATGIFVGAFAVIATEKFHKTAVALAAAGLMLLAGILQEQDSVILRELGIDFNVIFLLIGMMIIVNIARRTGIFEWLAVVAARAARGHPLRILLLLSLCTAVLSAFLDNVTTVLLIAPVTVAIAAALEIDPVPFLISEALASNIGGAATLIGDPPNIMIASRAQLTFMDFVWNLAPVVVLILLAFLVTIRFLFRRTFDTKEDLRRRISEMDHGGAITDPRLLRQSLLVLGATVAGFILHGYLHLQPAAVAMAGAVVLTLWARQDPRRLLREVEWPTILFFVGLFIMVGSLVRTGAIERLSGMTLELTGGNLFATSMFTMWLSAFASAVIDNIPYVATMNSMVIDMARGMWPGQEGAALLHQAGLMPVWWSLALGACLGGNGTLVGASANVIVSGVGERHGYPVTFKRFTLYGLPLMLESMAIATLYIWLRYY